MNEIKLPRPVKTDCKDMLHSFQCVWVKKLLQNRKKKKQRIHHAKCWKSGITLFFVLPERRGLVERTWPLVKALQCGAEATALENL